MSKKPEETAVKFMELTGLYLDACTELGLEPVILLAGYGDKSVLISDNTQGYISTDKLEAFLNSVGIKVTFDGNTNEDGGNYDN